MKKEKLYLSILDNLTDGVYFVNQQREITFWNKAAEQITGYTREDMEGKHCAESKLEHIDQDGINLCLAGCPLYETLKDGARREHEVLVRHKKGYRIPVIVKVMPIKSDEQPEEIVGAVEMFAPALPQIYEASVLESLQETSNELTERSTFLKKLIKFRLGVYTRFFRRFCVAMVELDAFDTVISTYGEAQAEEVKKAVLSTMRHSMPQGDSFDYWGENKFVGIFDINATAECNEIGDRILMLINRSEVVVGDARIVPKASIGVALVKRKDTVESILDRGEKLVDISKECGGNTVSVEVESPQELQVEKDTKTAEPLNKQDFL